MDGILNIHKPSGPTSFSIVAGIKRITREFKVGHGGTLDPLASGVLPVFLGKATRLAEYLMEYSKCYRAEIELGVSTDSYDAEGNVTGKSNASGITRDDIVKALENFKGNISQIPPMYSALKHGGQPLYKLARQGQTVEINSRPASIYRLEIVCFQSPYVTIDVECSKGTYIRSLANDLGAVLGCGAHLKNLVRTAYGPFDIKDACTAEQIEEAVSSAMLCELIQPMDTVLSCWEKVTLSGDQEELVRCGIDLQLETVGNSSRLRAYDEGANLVAILDYDAEIKLWHPQKVFHNISGSFAKKDNP